jgi:drug/metabolite transporter (DMT)-like permease
MWPLLVSRTTACLAVVALAVATGAVARPVAGVVRLALVAGSLDAAANLLYLLAVQRGLLALVAVLVALYPATTVALATVVLGERTGRTQRLGLAAAAASVALIAAG